MHTSLVGGVLTPKKQTCSATLNNLHGLARISPFVTRCLHPFTAKAPPTSDTHHTRGRRFNVEKANLLSGINNHLDLAVQARISLFVLRCLQPFHG